jgi:hypothetical protein
VVHRVGFQERLGVTLRPTRVSDQVEHGRRVRYVERRPGTAENLENRLSFVGNECVDIHQCSHITTPGRGVGDDEATVGVAHQNHGIAGSLSEKR